MTNLQLEGDKAVFVENLANYISCGKTREELEEIVRDVVLSELMGKDWADVLDLADDYCFPAMLQYLDVYDGVQPWETELSGL